MFPWSSSKPSVEPPKAPSKLNPMVSMGADPKTARKAEEITQKGMTHVKSGVVTAHTAIQEYMQKGATGLRFLAFVGGAGITLTGLLNIAQITGLITEPMYYLVNIYQVLFGVGILLLEAEPALVDKYESLSKGQAWVQENLQVLTTVWGRGVFYLYVGSVELFADASGSLLGLLLGCYLLVVAGLLIASDFGYGPEMVCAPVFDVLNKALGTKPPRGQANNNYILIQ